MESVSSEVALSRVNELLVEVACESETNAKSRVLGKARSILDQVISADPHNSDLHHALGLCWYYEPEWSDEARHSVEQCFRRALELEPGHQFASLYLGHFYFDERRYEDALAFFSTADDSYFENLGQHWRVLKNRELALSCRLYLDPNDVTSNEVDQLCSAYEAAEPEDWVPPTEIVVCLARVGKQTRSDMKVLAQRILQMIRELDFEKAYANLEEYVALKRIVSGN
jgi:tetratricopeptide (TPR) repeat protein